jgi:hypothetical protein
VQGGKGVKKKRDDSQEVRSFLLVFVDSSEKDLK